MSTTDPIQPAPPSPAWMNAAFVLLLAALAFLLASFPASNNDVWLHLATGRQLAEGTAAPSPGFFYNVLVYATYSVVGGPGLVVLKALLVVGIALALLRLSRADQGMWLPAGCLALGLLAMSTRLLLQPVTVSYFFLALTLLGLGLRDGKWRFPWHLLLLFAVWVNVDGWFVLGLAVVALVYVGQAIDGGSHDATPRRALAFALMVAVCLLNPEHYRAFRVPVEVLSPGAAGALQVMSPFQMAYFANLGYTPAVLAYFPLVALGLLSFVLVPRYYFARFLPWFALLALSAYQSRGIPFFAVVGVPVLAWNLQDALRVRGPARTSPGVPALLTLVLAGVLVVCAWPGWLQGPPYQPRRWAVEPAPGVEAGAKLYQQWLADGKFGPDAAGLHLSRETANAFAWFCPNARTVQDNELAAAVQGLIPSTDWPQRLRAAKVNHVIVYDADRGSLFANTGLWPLLHLDGNLAIFGWRDWADPTSRDAFRGQEVNLARLAFGPSAEAEQAPQAEDRRWWEAFYRPAPAPTARDEATQRLVHAESIRRVAPPRHLMTWEMGQSAGLATGLVGRTGPEALFDAYLRLTLFRPQLPADGQKIEGLPPFDRMSHVLQQAFTLDRDDCPPELLYLAIRTGRRAVAANPNDAQSYLTLGECYLRLLSATRERACVKTINELQQLRRVQASAALNRAIALKPDFAQPHLSLGGLYRDMGYLDLSLKHFQTYVRLTKQAGPPAGVSPEEFADQVAQFEDQVGRIERQVEERENYYAKNVGNARVLERALQAIQVGLAGRALAMLLDSDVSAFGQRGMGLQLELQLGTGRVRDVRDWTEEKQKDLLGPAYHWIRLQALAAGGEYDKADAEAVELGKLLELSDQTDRPMSFRTVMSLVIGQAILERQSVSFPDFLRWGAFGQIEFRNRINGLIRALRQQNDVLVLRGMLALEEGKPDVARLAFQQALAMWKNGEPGGLDFNGRRLAQIGLGYLE